MDDKEATDIAAALAPTQRPLSHHLARAATVATSVGERLRVGVVTLAGAYVGWRLVEHAPGLFIPPAVGAAVVGLLAAAIPVTRPGTMNMSDLGLSNPYLKFGIAFLLLGIALVAGSFVLETHDAVQYLGFVLLASGVVIYVIGRLAKAASSLTR